MDWLQVKIITTSKGIDPVCSALYDMGITGVQISDKDDFKEFLENNRKYWDYVDEELEKLKDEDSCITVYFPADASGLEQLTSVKSSLSELKNSDVSGNFGSLDVHIENMRDEDWAENWKKYFKPLEIGENILIVPEWEKDVSETNKTKFLINPGVSFGTGSHESTKMCIEEIEKHLKDGNTILDLGCGSGILSVIALLIGASDATAVDIDPIAVETAYSNLALNGLSREIYHGFVGDITTDAKLCETLSEKKYDIVLANIVADVIIALSSFVKSFMKDDGTFICSGIIIDRLDEVVEKLESENLKVIEIRKMGEWAAIICSK